MAEIARQERVDLFAVGSEYAASLNQPKQWKKVIRRVRSIYKGKITYVGNHDVSIRSYEAWQCRRAFLIRLGY